ncbi:aspartate carbamoyltransferase [Tistrella mobilis]|uniref:aspartate/ornithine carbamoyltransferase family protein n=1 Tax=Tistrella mobilis TaxID=171437 RepID=UPI003556920D
MSLISIDDIGRAGLERLFARVDAFAPADAPAHGVVRSDEIGQIGRRSAPLAGRIIAMLFFQASTRTRLSFEAAALRLGAHCIGFAEAGSARAGPGWRESLADTARMLNAYADAVVIRHPEAGAAADYLRQSTIPVINAGDGVGEGAEHPTQAILDLYTLRQARGRLDGVSVLVVGDLRQRAPRSLARALSRYREVTLHLMPAAGFAMSAAEMAMLRRRGLTVAETGGYDGVIERVDAVYLAGMEDPQTPVPAAHVLTPDVLARARADVLVLHPLPRGNELPPEIDGHRQAHYFRQAAYGVPVRMAVLDMLLGARAQPRDRRHAPDVSALADQSISPPVASKKGWGPSNRPG